MDNNPQRIELMIDIFEQRNQPAFALADLLPTGLITAILNEFAELEYLSASPANYQLLRTDNLTPLQEGIALKEQLTDGCHLHLVEQEKSLPTGTTTFSKPIYLRDQESGQVFPLRWNPAIIGRESPNVADNELVAVNLEMHPAALRVSRRHARIIEEGESFFLEALNQQNPTLVRQQAEPILVSEERHPLQHGDVIVLERSEISLKFIIRNEE